MSSRLRRWALLAAALLFASSVVGWVVKAAIKPHEYDYYNGGGYRYTTPTRPSPPILPIKNLPAIPQRFDDPVPIEPEDAVAFIVVIQDFQQAHAKRDLRGLGDPIDFNRMAEEWARFGVQQLRGQPLTLFQLDADAQAIRTAWLARAQRDRQTFRFGSVKIVSLAASDDEEPDAIVLARHTGSINGAKATWFTRWWMTKASGSWKVYDYEEQPSRLRVNAILSGSVAVMNTGNSFNNGSEAAQELVHVTAEMMRNHRRPALPSRLQSVRFCGPLEAMRMALVNSSKPLPSTTWDEAPIALLGESLKPTATTLQQFDSRFGGHPWADCLYSQLIMESDPKRAARDLETALVFNSGHPQILKALYPLLPVEERADLGTQAAVGLAPSEAIRELFDAYSNAKSGIDPTIKAFLLVRPTDPEANLALAVLMHQQGNAKKSDAALKIALDGQTLQAQVQIRERFAKMIEFN